MKIKICGLKRMEDIDIVNRYLPDYIGFVFAPSSRQVTIEQAQTMKKRLDPRIQAVGVFVDEKMEVIEKIIQLKIIDIVQFHGDESQIMIDYLKSHYDIQVIKAMTYDQFINYDVDYYLIDGRVAGSGVSWSYALPQSEKPVFIAGGITLDNLDDVMALHPYGIDISSGVETKGLKDEVKIEEVIRRVRYGKG